MLEPTYDTLRRRLLMGAWPAGQRLEAARLAADLGVSITPVRDSLNRLTGERLIVSQPGDGFHVPRLDEAGLRGLLDWHHAIVTMALGRERAGRPDEFQLTGGDLPERSAHLFASLVARARDEELDWAIENAAARLGRFRHHEAAVLAEADKDVGAIERMMDEADSPGLRAAIDYHHDRRRSAVDQLIAASRGGQII
ncbi:GntR family transcriptional regulator [Tardiphaga sp.]|uniref:GntR family transcriptional regulator n=1 Tax=Tardiphaga sp. TaxID=1926292 RepID=UPI00352A4BB2